MVNKVTLVGRLGKDPEVRRFDSDAAKAEFTLATNETYTNREGQRVENTEWHNIAIWRRGLVGVAEKYLRKGSLIYLDGKLRTRSWDDQDGNRNYMTEIIVDNFKMLDSRGDGGQRSDDASGGGSAPKRSESSTPSSDARPTASDGGSDDLDDDLPF